MEGGGGSGIGGFPGAPGNLLDAAAQEFHPTVCAPYPLQPLPHQLYCPHTYPAMPPPPQMAMLQPVPPMAMPMAPQPGYTLPTTAPVVDGPSSRVVVLCLVPPHAQERDVAQAMAPFGAIRSADACAVASEGVATVHFFDIRAAELAVACVREQHMRQQSRLGQLYAAAAVPPAWAPAPPTAPQAWDWPHPNDDGRGLVLGQVVWAHFAPGADDGENRGSLVVLSPLPGVSVADLRQVFQAFGDLKDVRESAHRPSHKFIDFFDTRDAARALAELNGQELFGRRLVIEFTRPSGPGPRRRGYAPHHRPTAPTPPRLQQATWRPAQTTSSQPPASSSSSSVSVRAREGVVLLRRPSDQAKGGNAGTRQERKSKGGKNVASSASAPASSSTPTASGKQAQKGAGSSGGGGAGGGGGNWKGRKSGWEARFLFKDPESAGDADTQSSPASERDTRTTVMIRNIPNKYSQKLLLNMLDNHCIQSNEWIAASGEAQPFSSYDFVYLPIDFNNKCNVGYGFVNLTSPEAAVRLYKAFHKQPWEVYNSRKICQVTYARVQGLDALKEHFKNSKFPCDSDEYLPVAFSPARDGKELTEPVPIVGRSPASGASSPPKSRAASVDLLGQELMPAPSSSADGASSTTTSTHALSEHADDDDNDEDIRLAGELRRLGYAD
ncbi:hypothetical protein BDA96_03G426200 [Sorghum bicolor]|uniref:RRM domain-containing protein n=2 Tax=Sorghum bicolor TaxID=4558 RepID=A0A921URJ1_SORBI|nr:hypothetical protein SORBI_3003G395200 [Sorghum bicolor]KAG0540640.1 hypothetical protein BDA96_03G426200 [Sorghum bicolor]